MCVSVNAHLRLWVFAQMIEYENMYAILLSSVFRHISKGFCSQDNGKQTGLEWCECWWIGVFWAARPLQGIVSQWSMTALSGAPSHHKQQRGSDHWEGMWTPSHKIPYAMFPLLVLSLSVSLLMDRVKGGTWLVHVNKAKPVKTHLCFHKRRCLCQWILNT